MSEHDFDGDDDIFSKSGRFGGNAEKRKDPAKPGGFGKSGNAGKPKDSTASSAGEGDAEAMRHLEHEFAAIDPANRIARWPSCSRPSRPWWR